MRHHPGATGQREDDILDKAEPEADAIAQIASLLARTQQQCIVSGLSFGYKAATSVLQAQSRLASHAQPSDVSSKLDERMVRTLVDDARGCLRDVAEAAAEEFRRLQVELSNLQEAMRAVAGDHSGQVYARRWKAKS